MNIVIITQNEPFYLAENLKYLIEIMPEHSKIVGCVVADVSPFGKKESFLKKAKRTYKIFGLNFFLYYSKKYILSKFNKQKNIFHLLNQYKIPEINLDHHINHKESVAKIKSHQPDLLISILGNQIFKEPIINLAPKGCINLHTALLPKYRGLMPTFWVLKNNEEKTGVSVFYVDKGIDSGPIIVQKEAEIGGRTQEELIRYTKKIGMEAIAESIDLIFKNEVVLIDNDASKKTYFTFPTKKDVDEFKRKGKKFY
ncbi:methionyl-tRNA formyltransferase [Winogradskyella sp. R77965]|uniref:methionyl-tRNA formyltransferase n=1 Tax=Winogradskyella sp. R77965 TaxID=3093872 RepID=UPI0037DDC670